MPIPIMPSVAKHFRTWSAPALLDPAVPCRLVPAFWGGRGRTSNLDDPAWTHWLDVPKEKDIRGSIQLGADSTSNWNMVDAGADFFVVCSAGDVRLFIVVWVEDRFLDTAAHYKRAYCIGKKSNPFLVPFPCP